MSYTTRFTLAEFCKIIGVKVPSACDEYKDELLTNLACSQNFTEDGGVYFVTGGSAEERKDHLRIALNSDLRLLVSDVRAKSLLKDVTVPHVTVPMVSGAILKASRAVREKLDLKVVGVTGSLGKTTTKDFVHAVLKQKYVAKKSLGNQNTIFPLFNNLQKMPLDTQFFVQEFGIGVKGTLPRTVKNCVPDAGIITNISDPHLDVYGTKENILQEKLSVITTMADGAPAFFNYDDELLKNVKLDNHPIVSYAVNNKEADYYAENIEVFTDHVKFDAVHKGEHIPVVVHALGAHNIGNALVAMAVGHWFGMETADIVKGIASYRGVGIRQNLVNIGGYQIYMDCYNTAPLSLVNAVKALCNLPKDENGKYIVVMGDIPRLGPAEKDIHIDTAKKIAETDVGLVICFGDDNAELAAKTLKECGKAAIYVSDRKELNYLMSSLITRKDIALVKGSVARLLSRSVDQVFGTSFHATSEKYERFEKDGFKGKIIYEKTDHDAKVVAYNQYTGSDKVVNIPSHIDGHPAFAITFKCFADNTELEEVVIGEGITNISNLAFRGCSNLKKVTLPSTLKYIGDSAFKGCTSLEKVVIHEGCIHIGASAFENCPSLKEITIPASVGLIGPKAIVTGRKAFAGVRTTAFCKRDSYAAGRIQTANIRYIK